MTWRASPACPSQPSGGGSFFGRGRNTSRSARPYAIGLKTFRRGSNRVRPAGGHGVGAFICYESAFPHLVRGFARAGAEALVNLSDDGYFARSAARQQHLKLVRMRALENGRWIVRSTNDGITAVIDPVGRGTQRLEPYQEAAAPARFAWSRETTFYTRHGAWFAWSCLLLGLAACAVSLAPRYSRGR